MLEQELKLLIETYEQRVKNLINEFDMSNGTKRFRIATKLACNRTTLAELNRLLKH